MTWQEARISDLGRVVTGKTPSTKNPAFFDGEYPFVTPSDLDWRTYYCQETERTVSEEAREQHKNQFIPENSTLVTCIGNTIGKCALSPSTCLTNQQINSIIPSDKFDPRFVYYLMLYNVDQIRGVGLSGGAATPILNKTSFAALRIKVPSKPVRDELGRLLAAYDDLIENNRRRVALLEEAARQLYLEWFVRLRFPGHEHSRIIDGVPEGWERTTFGDLCDAIREVVKPEVLEPDTPYIGLEHIPRRSIALSEWGSAKEVTSSKHRFAAGDVIFGKIRPYFHKVGIAFVNGVASSDAIVIRARNSDYSWFVLMTASSDPFVAATSQTMREGSKMPRADWKQMQAYPAPLPPTGLLGSFEATIEPIVEQLKTLTFANQKLRVSRDLLLPRLMNGEIAV